MSMHPTIVEHISYERGKNKMNDGESYFNQGEKRNIEHRGTVMDDYDAGFVDKHKEVRRAFDHLEYQLEELIYKVGDAPQPATEDEILNYLIGMAESVRIKRDQLAPKKDVWEDFPPLKTQL